MADLLELLNEISSENPCGENLEYDNAYLNLATAIQEKPEDLITGEKSAPPNWREVHKEALALLRRTKDLQVVIYLIRDLIHLEHVGGFRDGLNLLYGLLEKYWDTLHPVLDPDDNFDPTIRVNIIEELNNFSSVLRPLNLAILVDSKAVGRFSLRDIQLATDKIDLPAGATKPDIGLIKAAFSEVKPEVVQANYQAIIESMDLVNQIENLINEKVGLGNGPNLSALRAMLKDMRYAFEEFAPLAAAQATDLPDEEVLDETAGTAAPATVVRKAVAVGEIVTRQDVLKALDAILKYYAEYEPNSPVPILLQRAKYLATADFMKIIENLLPDGLSQLQQIKGPDPDASQY